MVKVKTDMTGWVMSEHGVPDSRLIVIKQVEDYIDSSGRHIAQWLCECSCENHNQIIVRGTSIRNGHTKSCGCLQNEVGNGVKKYNKFILNLQDKHGLYGLGYCSNTNKEFYFDMDDYNKIKDYCWSEDIGQDGYCRLRARDIKGKNYITMSHLIIGKYHDHADRNPMNNRKFNLRPASHTENARNHNKQKNNTSGIIGVSWHKRDHVWQAAIIINKKKIHLGYFTDKRDAIIARLLAEVKYFKEFAPQRHLFKQYNISIEEQNNDK